MSRRTRSGREFSPYDVFVTQIDGFNLGGDLVADAINELTIFGPEEPGEELSDLTDIEEENNPADHAGMPTALAEPNGATVEVVPMVDENSDQETDGVCERDRKRKITRSRSEDGVAHQKKRRADYNRRKRTLKRAEADLHSNASAVYGSVVSTQAELCGTKGSAPGVTGLRFLRTEDVPSFDLPFGDDLGQATELGTENVDILPTCQPIVKQLCSGIDGWRYVRNLPKNAQILSDKQTRGAVSKLRPPLDEDWPNVVNDVDEQMAVAADGLGAVSTAKRKATNEASGDKWKPTTRQKDPSQCPSINFGISLGGGQTCPKTLVHSKKVNAIIEGFIHHPSVKRYTNHIACGLKIFFPAINKAFKYTRRNILRTSIAKDLLQQHIFDLSPFCATTLNLGPKADASFHRDHLNLLFGICAIGVFGTFDHRTSGHLLLQELKVVMELRHGDVILIPSALITHANSGLYSWERRRSIVQYTAGGLFRWMWNDYKTEPKGIPKLKQRLGKERWDAGWDMFPKLCDLEATALSNDTRAMEASYQKFIDLFTYHS